MKPDCSGTKEWSGLSFVLHLRLREELLNRAIKRVGILQGA